MDKSMKKELLEELKKEMMDMKSERKSDMFKDMMPEKEDVQKVTVMADSEEGLKEGLSKAQEIMKAKLGQEPKEEKEDNTCPKCKGKENCSCE